ncbi:MAG: AraC family transcriptional regulator [Myxococcaceae bacterium]|nr:AraC family transcriptional regulator [Myxococcaceae bacterium]MCI0672300.1 AraC family transcriptional regulator [Myxococcaceae bacterium]
MFSTPLLDFGRYLGIPVLRVEQGGLVLTESTYAPGTVLPLHRHRNAGFRLTMEGGFTDLLEGRARERGPQAVDFHGPEEAHSQKIADRFTRTFNIDFSESAWQARQPLVNRLSGGMELPSGVLAPLTVRIYQEFRRNDDMSPLAIEGLSLEVIAEALRSSSSMGEPSLPTWLRRVRELLEEVRIPPPTLSDLAREAGVSPLRLGRVFRQHFRCSPAEYLRRARLERACRALRETLLPLSEVAMDAGYCDQSHMNRELTRHLRMTPVQYRQKAWGQSFHPTGG